MYVMTMAIVSRQAYKLFVELQQYRHSIRVQSPNLLTLVLYELRLKAQVAKRFLEQ